MTDELTRLLDAVNDLTGEAVQATMLLTLVGEPKISDMVASEGVAAWAGETLRCAPGFLRLGDSGHGSAGAELIAGGERWHNECRRYSIVSARHRDADLQQRIDDAKAADADKHGSPPDCGGALPASVGNSRPLTVGFNVANVQESS